MFSEKCAFGGFNSTSRSPRSLDRTSPDLFRLTREESLSKSDSPILNIFIRSKEIGRQTSKSTKIGPNFACFWPLKIFRRRSPNISARDYKIEHTLEHRTKFRADRPTELRDNAARKKRMKSKQNRSPSENYRFRADLLEIWGKAQRESARRPKFDWGKLGVG